MSETTNKVIIDSGISKRHARDWKADEAIREIVQNWIDVTAEQDVGGFIHWEQGFATIADQGTGLQLKHFAFGESEKGENAIGQFGEGLKSAIIFLVRNGRHVQIETNEYVITPFMKISEIFQIETLHYELLPPSGVIEKGTRIFFECEERELNKAQGYFVKFAEQNPNWKWLDHGRHFSLPGGNLYINGSLISSSLNSKISYHLYGSEAGKLINRDRDNINDPRKLLDFIGDTICDYGDKQVASIILENMLSGENNYENSHLYLHNYLTEDVLQKVWAKEWQKISKKISPHRPLALATYNPETNAQAEYHGFELLHTANGNIRSFLSLFLPLAESAVREKNRKSRTRIRQKDLTPTEQYNLRTAKALVRKHYKDLGGRLGDVEIYDRLFASGGSPARGMYDPSKDLVMLSRSILNSLYATLFTLTHELVHKTSGANDLTVSFETALLQVAIDMMMEEDRKKEERRLKREQKNWNNYS